MTKTQRDTCAKLAIAATPGRYSVHNILIDLAAECDRLEAERDAAVKAERQACAVHAFEECLCEGGNCKCARAILIAIHARGEMK